MPDPASVGCESEEEAIRIEPGCSCPPSPWECKHAYTDGLRAALASHGLEIGRNLDESAVHRLLGKENLIKIDRGPAERSLVFTEDGTKPLGPLIADLVAAAEYAAENGVTWGMMHAREDLRSLAQAIFGSARFEAEAAHVLELQKLNKAVERRNRRIEALRDELRAIRLLMDAEGLPAPTRERSNYDILTDALLAER